VNLRHLVPALGLVAFTAAPALAAEGPSVSFAGWVDTILSFSQDDDPTIDNPATEKDDTGATIGFSSQASLKAMWKVTDALSAKVNLWFNPEYADLRMREAYFAWALNDTVTWSMGKYIDHLGWIAAEPTGLYTVNASLIGYTAAYGNDVIGTSIAVAPKDSPISGSFHITNGYFTDFDADSVGVFDDRDAGRENTDLGFGLDVIYTFPEDMGNINFELAYDMASGDDAFPNANRPANGLGGDVFVVGVNATVKPVKPLMIGAEVMYLMLDEATAAGGGSVANSSVDRLQAMLLANYAIEGSSFPMSVTGMLQYIDTEQDGAANSQTDLGVAIALMTNPLNSSNFGLNFELGFFDSSDIGGVAGAENDGVALSVEGLVTF
jgi:hypothetical protein